MLLLFSNFYLAASQLLMQTQKNQSLLQKYQECKMNIKMDDIIAFVCVAEVGGFIAAAEELCITPSALSRRIKKLEDELGATLLDRTTRSVSVSTIGQEFLPEAIRMVEGFYRTLSDITDLIQVRRGSVRIACNNTVSDTILPEVLSVYREKNPEIKIKVIENSSPEVRESVLRGEAELGITTMTESHNDLDFQPLFEDSLLVICRIDHPLAQYKNVTWNDIKNLNYIHLRRESGTKLLLEKTLGSTFSELTGDIEVSHTSALLRMVANGLGVSATPSLVWYKRTDTELVSLPVSEPRVSRTIGIVTRRHRSLSPAAQRLRKCCIQVMKNSPELIH